MRRVFYNDFRWQLFLTSFSPGSSQHLSKIVQRRLRTLGWMPCRLVSTLVVRPSISENQVANKPQSSSKQWDGEAFDGFCAAGVFEYWNKYLDIKIATTIQLFSDCYATTAINGRFNCSTTASQTKSTSGTTRLLCSRLKKAFFSTKAACRWRGTTENATRKVCHTWTKVVAETFLGRSCDFVSGVFNRLRIVRHPHWRCQSQPHAAVPCASHWFDALHDRCVLIDKTWLVSHIVLFFFASEK